MGLLLVCYRWLLGLLQSYYSWRYSRFAWLTLLVNSPRKYLVSYVHLPFYAKIRWAHKIQSTPSSSSCRLIVWRVMYWSYIVVDVDGGSNDQSCLCSCWVCCVPPRPIFSIYQFLKLLLSISMMVGSFPLLLVGACSSSFCSCCRSSSSSGRSCIFYLLLVFLFPRFRR